MFDIYLYDDGNWLLFGDINTKHYDVEKFLAFTCMTKDKLLIEDDQA